MMLHYCARELKFTLPRGSAAFKKDIYGINPQETKWRPGECIGVIVGDRASDDTFEEFER